ncbi:heparinase II/III-family protein [Streptomyces sp. NBC_00257]|uniref:heparinase II/III domain-containing protein n=1 Tax=unclassified Streptomyces TaxID=2593676 RepID=UPI002250BA43|nr:MULTISPECIES: heparinase II/III family protein [unclassified Streptomyces]WTB58346.1 heparinase II/III-family protein [Streptomyces sp. NBC_00826]WTH88774.1 heparinase II/III-family protein [Streptomyces sp. NBC_00825]WTH97504.1 heparinase II/III-family protein [Streptomyces sp. NBC_00822]MCX4863022.1 heparinase II/III-family protein [Streptomyces sp. NBC_00906]MCX4894259.1 heparinase II/III-family protein [Streptomyces sp. NBC_00892]
MSRTTRETLDAALRAGRREDLTAGYLSPDLWERARASPLTGKALAGIEARAEEWARTDIGPLTFSRYRRFAEDGARRPYENDYFARRSRLMSLGITALARPGADTGPLEDIIWAICDEYTWSSPAHIEELLSPHPALPHAEQIDLFAAETAFALAEIRRLLAERISPLVAERIRAEVIRRVLDPIRGQRPFWETVETNWSAVCACSVGMAALYLLDEAEDPADADALAEITARMIDAMDCFLAGYGDDGACPEGLSYWTYGFGFFTIYADALHRRTGGRIDLFDDPTGKIEEIARFPHRVQLSGTAIAAFADSPPTHTLPPGLVARLSRRFPGIGMPPEQLLDTEPVDRLGRWGPALRGMVWANELPVVAPASAGSGSGTYFPDAQWMIVRSRTAGREVGFAAKGGHNEEPHNHNDLGSFVVAVDGQPLLAELGAGFYNGQYFGPDRYDILCTGSQGHSVPLLNGTVQRASREAAAEVLAAEHAPGRALFRIDISAAYPVAGLTSLVREFTFTDGVLTLRDRFEAEAPLDITERFMSFAPIEVTAPGEALIQGDTAALRLYYDATAWQPRVNHYPHVRQNATGTTVHSLDLRHTGATAHFELRARPE